MKPVPVSALANAFEFEEAAKAKLSPSLFAEIADGPRGPFERITLRPRMMVNTRQLDLSQELFGVRHFAPILVNNIPRMGNRFYSDGEAEWTRGVAAAKAFSIANGLEADPKLLQVNVERGDWTAFDKLRKSTKIPIIVRGMPVNLAKDAVSHGANGFLIAQSSRASGTSPHPMDMLVPIVDAVGSRIPVLIGGGFRRGTDILMALALGAKAVVVTRPVAWALAAYGAEGVQTLLELLQTELARNMAMCGKVTLAELDRTLVKIHRV